MAGDAEVCRNRMAGDMIEVCRNQDGRRHGSVQKPGWRETQTCAETRIAGDMIKVCRNQDSERHGNVQKPGSRET